MLYIFIITYIDTRNNIQAQKQIAASPGMGIAFFFFQVKRRASQYSASGSLKWKFCLWHLDLINETPGNPRESEASFANAFITLSSSARLIEFARKGASEKRT